MPSPVTLSANVHLTHNCNLRCTYCFTGEKFGAGMSQATADQTVDFCIAEFVRSAADHLQLIFFGGEPLPHQTSPYGTGVPDRVDGDLARRVIERVFASAGYNLRPNVPYDKDGVAFVVDGYDAQNRIGFVVGDWSNLDDDAIVSWMSRRRPARGGNSSEVEWWAALAESKVMGINDGEKQRFANDVATAKRLADPAKAKAALKAIMDRMSKRYLSYEEIQSLETAAREYIEWAKTQGLE